MQTKRFILIGTTIVISIVMWWSAHQWLIGDQLSDWHRFLGPLLIVILYGSVLGFALTFLKTRVDRLAVITASWASFVLFFPASIWYLSALPIFFLFLMSASRRSQRELEERHKFRVRSVIGVGTRLVLLGVFLMVSLGHFTIRAQSTGTVQALSSGVQRSVDSTFDSSFLESSLDRLSESAQAQLRRDAARYVETFAQQWLGPLGPALPPLLSLALFLVLWSLIGILREPILWLSSGLFKLGTATGFISVKEEQVPKEVVSIN